MKGRLLLALLILLMASPLLAQEQVARMSPMIVGGGVPVAAPPAGVTMIGVATTVKSDSLVASIATGSRSLTAGSNRVLVVCVSAYNGTDGEITSVNFDVDSGNDWPFTKLASVHSSGIIGTNGSIWYAAEPGGGGTTGHVDVALGDQAYPIVVLTEWTGVNQTTPMDGGATHAITENNAPHISISSETGAVVISCVQGFVTTETISTTDTEIYNGTASTYILSGISTHAGAATYDMIWSKSASTRWTAVGGSINPN